MESRKAQYYREKIKTLIGLPTLPTIAIEIQNIMREDKLSVVQTVPIIEQDPSLALKILKVANSAFYGMREKVNSLRAAVVIIGMRDLSGIVLGFSVLKTLSKSEDSSELNWKMFWEHSIAVGHIVELLDEELGINFKESLYAIGLLHDIGQLVLYRIEPLEYEKAYKLSMAEGRSLIQAEEQILGVTHEQAGQWIAERWGLSPLIQAVNGNHHHLSNIEDVELRLAAALVQLASYIADSISMNFGYRNVRTHGDIPEAWEILQTRSARARNTEFNDLLNELENHWEAVREMVKLLNM